MGLIRSFILFVFFIGFTFSVVAQLDYRTEHQAFKMEKGSVIGAEVFPVSILPLGNEINYLRNAKDKSPLNGTYQFVINSRRYVIGSVVKGIPQGDWEEYYYDKLFEKAFYKNGRPHGKIELYTNHPFGGHAHYAEYIMDEGVILHFISYHANDQLKEERFYKNGRIHGVVKTFDENGKLLNEVPYEDGKIQGTVMEVKSNGEIEYADYVQYKRNGKYRLLYPNGNVKEEGFYLDYKKDGLWKKGDENGNILLEEEYQDQKLHGIKREYFTGNRVKSEEEYVKGIREGRAVYYDESPYTINREGTYLKGEMHGVFKVYHQGILWRETIYDKGREVGKKEYANGRLEVIKLMDETGRLIDVVKYDSGGKKVYQNQNYIQHSSLKLKENVSGVIDIEF